MEDEREERRVRLWARMRGVGGAWELVQLQRLSSCWRLVSDRGDSGGGWSALRSGSGERGTSREEMVGQGLFTLPSDAVRLIRILSLGAVAVMWAISGALKGGLDGGGAVITWERG